MWPWANAPGTQGDGPPGSERGLPRFPDGAPVMPARKPLTGTHGLRRGTRDAAAWLRGWLPVPGFPVRPAAVGRVREVLNIGPNPGGLRMLVYAPPRLPPDAPLVVVLHG